MGEEHRFQRFVSTLCISDPGMPSFMSNTHHAHTAVRCAVCPLRIFEAGSQNATLVVLVVVIVISSLKIPMAFLIRSGAQQNFAYTFLLTFPTGVPSQIFHLFSN